MLWQVYAFLATLAVGLASAMPQITIPAQAKDGGYAPDHYFQYINVPKHKHYEWGYRKGNDKHHREEYLSQKDHTFKAKVGYMIYNYESQFFWYSILIWIHLGLDIIAFDLIPIRGEISQNSFRERVFTSRKLAKYLHIEYVLRKNKTFLTSKFSWIKRTIGFRANSRSRLAPSHVRSAIKNLIRDFVFSLISLFFLEFVT